MTGTVRIVIAVDHTILRQVLLFHRSCYVGVIADKLPQCLLHEPVIVRESRWYRVTQLADI